MISKAAGGRPPRIAGGTGLGPGLPDHRAQLASRRVVVGVDGSPGSAAAFRCAASQARQRNASLDVVCVISGDADAAAARQARAMLGELTRRECPLGAGVPVRLRVERGDPQVVLLLVSAGAELLINGHQGR